MSKPKAREYAPSPGEKLQASVAKAQYDEWNKVFKPAEDRFVADTQRDITSTVTGRANADVAQALGDASTGSGYRQTQNMSDIGGLWNAAMVSQNVAATKAGGSIESGMMSDALEAVTNRSGTLSKNIAAGANIGRTNVLNEAKNKLAVRNAYWNAGAKVGGSLLNQGMKNIGGGGSFFSPNVNEGRVGQYDTGAIEKMDPNTPIMIEDLPRYQNSTQTTGGFLGNLKSRLAVTSNRSRGRTRR
jgi:hypothetical protein